MSNVQTAMSVIGKFAEMSAAANAGSLVEFSKPSRVEPVTLVDSGIIGQPFMTPVLQTALSMFTAYYLSAASLLVNIGNVNTRKILSALNPNRDVLDAGATLIGEASGFLGQEAFKHKLPVIGQPFGLEAYGVPEAMGGGACGRDVVDRVANLAVGKMIEVNIESNGHKAVLPVNVRLQVSAITPDRMVHTLAIGNQDVSAAARYHAWREGSLSLIRDIIFCQDMMREHRKALLEDKSGVYKQNIKRKRGNTISAILTGTPSLATASNIYVMSDTTAARLGAEVGGRLSDFKIRQKVFAKTNGMIMMVVEPKWEVVTIYVDSIADSTELTFSQITTANKGDGLDITKLMAQLLKGSAPNL